MNIITLIRNLIERVRSRLIPYKDIAAAEQIRTPLAPEMIRALSLWSELYHDRAPWKEPGKVKSLNLCAMAASEIARQVVLEMKVTVDAGGEDAEGLPTVNARSEYLKGAFAGLLDVLRQKLELGCAAGGMIVKPCPDPATGRIWFDFAPDWSLYPLAFDGAGNLSDVIIPDVFRDGDVIYTRLERHTLVGMSAERSEAEPASAGAQRQDAGSSRSAAPKGQDSRDPQSIARARGDVVITQRAFRSTHEDALGVEVPLASVDRWAALEPEVTVTGAGGMLFGWYKVAAANTVDADCALGASVYAKAVEVAKEVDLQYSRLLWEFEGGELAVDVDPTALYEKSDGKGNKLPKLNERLFRAVDTGAESTYEVFAPTLRDVSLVNGLNQLLIRFEDLCGLSRGTFSDANVDARTATELKIVKQRSYATVADNQKALEKCLRDVLRAMDVYATLYGLAPAGEWAASFEWDDSILTDVDAQLQQRLLLVNSGIMSKAELRQWYLGETEVQAEAAVAKIRNEGAKVEGDGDDAFCKRE